MLLVDTLNRQFNLGPREAVTIHLKDPEDTEVFSFSLNGKRFSLIRKAPPKPAPLERVKIYRSGNPSEFVEFPVYQTARFA